MNGGTMRKLLLILALTLPLQACGSIACGLCALHQILKQQAPAPTEAPLEP